MAELGKKYSGSYLLGTLIISAGVCILPFCFAMLAYIVAEAFERGEFVPLVGALWLFALPALFLFIGRRSRIRARTEYITAIQQVLVWFIYVIMAIATPYAIWAGASTWQLMRHIAETNDPYGGVGYIAVLPVLILAGGFTLLYVVFGAFYFLKDTFFKQGQNITQS